MSTSLDTIAAHAETIAISPLARDALAHWNHSQAQAEWRRKRESAAPRDHLDMAGHPAACSDAPLHPEFIPGLAVWYQPPLPAGVVKFVRGMVLDRRDNLGRILIANIDEPKMQLYASPKHLRRRHAREVAPGIYPSGPNGDDAA